MTKYPFNGKLVVIKLSLLVII